MKTDQIVAHGHAAIKQLLAYMGKIWAFLFPTLTLPMLSHSFSFPFFFLPWHRGKAYISYSLFISPSLLTVCVCVVAAAELAGWVTGLWKGAPQREEALRKKAAGKNNPMTTFGQKLQQSAQRPEI